MNMKNFYALTGIFLIFVINFKVAAQDLTSKQMQWVQGGQTFCATLDAVNKAKKLALQEDPARIDENFVDLSLYNAALSILTLAEKQTPESLLKSVGPVEVCGQSASALLLAVEAGLSAHVSSQACTGQTYLDAAWQRANAALS